MARGKKKESTLTPEEKLAQALVPVEEQPYKVPENWCWVKLSALSTLISKGTTPTGGKNAYVSEGVHFLRVENINDDGTISHDNIACVTEQMHTGFLKRSVLENRDVLVSIAGTLGKTGIVRDIDLPLNTNQAVAFVRLKTEDVNERYIKGVIDNPITQELLLGKTKVTSIPNLTLEIIGDCLIPLAPIAEQQRIVDRIEYLFAKLDEAKEKAQSVLDSFETRKAAILHKAFTGELTVKWRVEHGLVVDTWNKKPLVEVTYNHDSRRIPLSQAERSNLERRYDYYGASGVIDKVDRFLFEGRNLLIGEDGANLVTRSKPIAFIADGQYWVNNHAHVLSTKAEMVLDFLCYYINSIDLTPYVTGSAQPKMTQAKMNGIPVPVPSVPEQTEIVRILDSLFAKEQQAKEAAEAVLEKIELLKKSILVRAFRAELGTNDPSEESAMELLKIIL